MAMHGGGPLRCRTADHTGAPRLRSAPVSCSESVRMTTAWDVPRENGKLARRAWRTVRVNRLLVSPDSDAKRCVGRSLRRARLLRHSLLAAWRWLCACCAAPRDRRLSRSLIVGMGGGGGQGIFRRALCGTRLGACRGARCCRCRNRAARGHAVDRARNACVLVPLSLSSQARRSSVRASLHQPG